MEEKLQVLVVDDEADIRGLLRVLLERHGMAVIEAANGRQAITAIQVHSGLDLVILDVMMPKCDGVQACSEIRKLSSVPILFLTARTQEADMRDAYASGGDDYLGKAILSGGAADEGRFPHPPLPGLQGQASDPGAAGDDRAVR